MSEDFGLWQINTTLAEIIAGDEHGPFPDHGSMIRCSLRDGQVIDGMVVRVWLDLDIVRMEVVPSVMRGFSGMNIDDMIRSGYTFRVTPAEGDSWQSK